MMPRKDVRMLTLGVVSWRESNSLAAVIVEVDVKRVSAESRRS